jgi:hypothetical protein
MTAIQTHDATSSNHHDAAQRGRRLSSPIGHFIRHYIEMVVAMFLGMAVLGIPAGWALTRSEATRRSSPTTRRP